MLFAHYNIRSQIRVIKLIYLIHSYLFSICTHAFK